MTSEGRERDEGCRNAVSVVCEGEGVESAREVGSADEGRFLHDWGDINITIAIQNSLQDILSLH